MTDKSEYLKHIEDFYEHKLKSQLKNKYRHCNNCNNEKEFIEKDGYLIYSCGSSSGKCSIQYQINLANYAHYPTMKHEINEYLTYYLDLDKLKNYISVDKELKEQTNSINTHVKL